MSAPWKCHEAPVYLCVPCQGLSTSAIVPHRDTALPFSQGWPPSLWSQKHAPDSFLDVGSGYGYCPEDPCLVCGWYHGLCQPQEPIKCFPGLGLCPELHEWSDIARVVGRRKEKQFASSYDPDFCQQPSLSIQVVLPGVCLDGTGCWLSGASLASFCLDSNSSFTPYELCELGQVALPFCALVSLFFKCGTNFSHLGSGWLMEHGCVWKAQQWNKICF